LGFNRSEQNIFHLGIKVFRSVYRDPGMLVLIAWAFSLGIYVAAHAQPEKPTAAANALSSRAEVVAVSKPSHRLRPAQRSPRVDGLTCYG
jgi:hypothetical protein